MKLRDSQRNPGAPPLLAHPKRLRRVRVLPPLLQCLLEKARPTSLLRTFLRNTLFSHLLAPPLLPFTPTTLQQAPTAALIHLACSAGSPFVGTSACSIIVTLYDLQDVANTHKLRTKNDPKSNTK